jgi:hypothetical protein
MILQLLQLFSNKKLRSQQSHSPGVLQGIESYHVGFNVVHIDSLTSLDMNLEFLTPDEVPRYEIVYFTSGPPYGEAYLTIRCYGKQFHLVLNGL